MNVRDDIELYDITADKALSYAAKELSKDTNISLKEAKILVKNALIYNVVIEEIVSHAKWLMNIEQEDE